MPQKQETGKPLTEMDFFELSAISMMPDDIYKAIKERLTLVLTYLEDGALNTAKNILEKFL